MTVGDIFTEEEKELVLKVLDESYSDVDKWPSMEDASREAAKQAVGKNVSYWTVRYKWIKTSEECAELFSRALLHRAEHYMKKCHQTIENIEEFWEAPVLDSKAEIRLLTKERMTAVNRARLKLEHYAFRAACYAPDLYGDYRHEIKKIEENIKAMNSKIDAIISNKV